MRILFFILIDFSKFYTFAQKNVCGDYFKPFYGADISIRLSIKPDSTFEYLYSQMGKYKQAGRWKKCGDVLMLYGCEGCIMTEQLQIKTKR